MPVMAAFYARAFAPYTLYLYSGQARFGFCTPNETRLAPFMALLAPHETSPALFRVCLSSFGALWVSLGACLAPFEVVSVR